MNVKNRIMMSNTTPMAEALPYFAFMNAVWKIRKTAARKAAQEVRALAAHVFEKMEIAQ